TGRGYGAAKIVIFCNKTKSSLPACFCHSRDLTGKRHVTERHTGNAELTDVSPGPAGQLAAVAHTHGRRITRKLIQCFPVACSLERCPLLRVFLNKPPALRVPGLHA